MDIIQSNIDDIWAEASKLAHMPISNSTAQCLGSYYDAINMLQAIQLKEAKNRADIQNDVKKIHHHDHKEIIDNM